MTAPAGFAPLPEPPYYAVIFTSQLGEDVEGYAEMSARMFDLALRQPGCLGAESARDGGGLGITVSYWRDEGSIRAWKGEAMSTWGGSGAVSGLEVALSKDCRAT